MAREISSRFRLNGTVVAKTPLHVGGHGDDVDTDLPLARDGRGNLYVPGTSLAGALRQWCAQAFCEKLIDLYWGFQDGDLGHASFVFVEDMPVNESTAVVVEVRDGVGIDREWGAAAETIKYDRAILPRGTKLTFALSAEVKDKDDRLQVLAMLASLQDALSGGRVRLGASKTRGLGRVELHEPKLTEQTLDTRQGILALLKGSEASVNDRAAALQAHQPKEAPRLEVVIDWAPAGPLMVKAGFDGIAVDMLPLVSGRDGGLSLVLPGSSVKGAMRAQAERIIRTVLGLDLCNKSDPKKKFLHDLDVKLVNDLFGLRGLSDEDAKEHYGGSLPTDGPLHGLSALSVDDCFGTQALTAAQWQAVHGATNDRDVRAALDAAGLSSWAEAYHVAVDRWTGAAADSMLYTVLEPHRVSWEKLRLEIDLSRLTGASQGPAVALLLLVLRDLAQGRLPLGFATHRGMGALAIKSATIMPYHAASPLDQLGNVTVSASGLSGVPAAVNSAWKTWIQNLPERAHMSATKLFVHCRLPISLAEAVTAFAKIPQDGAVVGLLYSPRSCAFALLSSGALHGSGGEAIDLRPVFEARAFGMMAELRWLNDPSAEGKHKAVILAEKDLAAALGDGWKKMEPIIDAIDTLDQTYLLWGKGTGNAISTGWSQLGEARIGALPVPIPNVNKSQGVLLSTREYLAAEDKHGNVVVREERLCGLKLGEVERG